MRHITIMLLLPVTALLVACGDGEALLAPADTPSQPAATWPVAFDSYVSRATRGAVSDLNAIAGDGNQGFGVFAMYTNGKTYSSGSTATTTAGDFTPDFMGNVQVKGTAAADGSYSWAYAPLRYWPAGATEYVSFLAYAPWKEGMKLVNSDGSEEGDRTYIGYNFTAGSDGYAKAADTYDLLYNSNDLRNQYLRATTDANGQTTYSTNISSDHRVKISFAHATARIGFAITSTALTNSNNFSIGGTTGNVTISVNSFTIGKFYRFGYLNLLSNATQRWTVPNADDRATFSFANTDTKKEITEGQLNATASSGNKWTPGSDDAKYIIQATRTSTTATATVNAIGNSADGYLFVMPQDFTASGQLECKISYTVTDNVTNHSTTYNATGAITKNFEAGGAYLIIVDIGTGVSFSDPSFTITDQGTKSEEGI